MNLGVTILINALLCCLICTCKGTPPDQQSNRQKYENLEDQFIFNELSNILDGRTPVFRDDVWLQIAEKHREKWKASTPGFPQERSLSSLRSRFRDILLQRLASVEVTVPEPLMQKILKGQSHLLEKGKNYKNAYTEEENDLIFEELRRSSVTKLFAESTREAICAALKRKRLANTNGFARERNARSIRTHLLRMKQKGHFPKDLSQKFKLIRKETNVPDVTGDSASTSTAQNQQSDEQETINDDLENDEVVADIFKDILNSPICDIDFSKFR